MTKFEVGNRVVVYFTQNLDRRFGYRVVKATVEEVHDEVLKTDAGYFHQKQCRRLVKKKRREIYVANEALYYINNPKYCIYERPNACVPTTKFIEAKRGK